MERARFGLDLHRRGVMQAQLPAPPGPPVGVRGRHGHPVAVAAAVEALGRVVHARAVEFGQIDGTETFAIERSRMFMNAPSPSAKATCGRSGSRPTSGRPSGVKPPSADRRQALSTRSSGKWRAANRRRRSRRASSGSPSWPAR